MRHLLLVLACFAAVSAAADVGAPATFPTDEYRLGPKDLLEIKVLEIPELSVERRVSENGSISLPLLGDFPVSNLTATEVKDHLQELLKSKFVNRADVSVVIKEFANKPISVLGAVHRPGSLTLSGRWTLLEAISAAGGLTEAAGRRIVILRHPEGKPAEALEFSTEEVFRGSAAIASTPIYPADVINVPARGLVKVYCLGEVKNSGAIEFTTDDRITLLSVLAKAGGLTDRASKTIRIKRRDSSGRDVETVVDYKRILSGKDPDPVLKADDVVVIKESFF